MILMIRPHWWWWQSNCLVVEIHCILMHVQRRRYVTSSSGLHLDCTQHTHYTLDCRDVTHTHPFSGPLSGTTQVNRYQKDKTNLDITEARHSEWQWHQLDHMQICTSLQTDNHASTTPLSFYRPDALPATQATVSKH